MNKNQRMLAVIMLFLIVLFAGAGLFLLSSKNVFEYSFEGVILASDSAEPLPVLKSFAEEQSFVVSPEFRESGNINQYMGNSMQLFVVVLSGNKKDITQLIRVIDSSGNLVECGTNHGNVKQSETISAEECTVLIESLKQENVFVDIKLPSPEKGAPRALVEGKTLTITTASYEYVGNTVFSIIKLAFPNAEEILSSTNNSVSGLSDSI